MRKIDNAPPKLFTDCLFVELHDRTASSSHTTVHFATVEHAQTLLPSRSIFKAADRAPLRRKEIYDKSRDEQRSTRDQQEK